MTSILFKEWLTWTVRLVFPILSSTVVLFFTLPTDTNVSLVGLSTELSSLSLTEEGIHYYRDQIADALLSVQC